MDWKRTILVAGKRTTPEEWLAEAWERITDRQFAEAFRRAGFRHINRNMVREKRRTLGLNKAVSRHDRPDPEDISRLAIEIDDPGPAVVTTGAIPAGPAPANGIDAKEVLRSIRNRPKTLRELSSEFDRSEDTIGGVIEALKQQHFNIVQIDGRHSLDTKSVQAPDAALPRTLADETGMRLALGIISDLHAGSTAQQITSLSQFIHRAAEQGVQHFLVPGDLVAGTEVYRGQIHDLYAIGADKQLAALLETLPEIPPVAYYVIGGNHDHSFVKATGYNIVAAFAAQREDVHYFGFDMGDVPLTDRVDARLWHPSGGVPYAMCLSQDTQILTRRGWIGHDAISMADEVATLNPVTHELEYQRPAELFVYQYEGKMIRVHSRTVDLMVTPQHDLWVRPYNEGQGTGEWRKTRAGDAEFSAQFRRQKWQMDMTATWRGEETETLRIPFHKWSGARDLGEMPMDAFLEFLGWYISEGHTQRGKIVCVTQMDPEETKRIVVCMERIGLKVKVYLESRAGANDIYRIRAHNASLTRWLGEHAGEGAKNKHVPKFVKELSARQIGIFLDALFAGDGTKKAGCRWYQYTSISEQLKDDVQELALKAGTAATIHRGEQKKSVGVLEQNMPTINKKPAVADYSGIVWCVHVPNGLIYARRNGKPVWTGNSYRLQKGMEQMAYDELTNAIQRADNPKMRVVVSGHLHVAMTMWRGPIIGLQAGCWEGQTNYLKRKALYPQVGGYIVELWLTDSGLIQRCRHEFHPYLEIENDYRNYPDMLERIGVTPGEGEARPLFAWEPGEEGEDDSGYDHKPNGCEGKEN